MAVPPVLIMNWVQHKYNQIISFYIEYIISYVHLLATEKNSFVFHKKYRLNISFEKYTLSWYADESVYINEDALFDSVDLPSN